MAHDGEGRGGLGFGGRLRAKSDSSDTLCLNNLIISFPVDLGVISAAGVPRMAEPDDFRTKCWDVFKTESNGATKLNCDKTLEIQLSATSASMRIKQLSLCPGCFMTGGGDGLIFSYWEENQESLVYSPNNNGDRVKMSCGIFEP